MSNNGDVYYFEKELTYLKEKSKVFSQNFPDVANALGITKDSVEDPEIARLIESVCMLNGRIQKRLDDGYSDFTESLLNIIYPDFLKPIPSYSIINIDIDDKANAVSLIPKNSLFELRDDNTHCYYKTVSDLTIYPIKISRLNNYVAPFDEINNIADLKAKNIIELVFNTTDSSLKISDLNFNQIDLSLKSDSTNFAFKLYNEIRHQLVDIYIEINGVMYNLEEKALSNKVFSMENPIVPYSNNSFDGLNLLHEFFMFYDVFSKLSIDLSKVKDLLTVNSFKLKFYFKEFNIDILRTMSLDNFKLYTVPIVNLYEKYAEPINVDFLKDEYPIIIHDNDETLSLYKILSVVDSHDSIVTNISELYSDNYGEATSSKKWLAKYSDNEGIINGKLRIIDSNHNVALESNHSLLINTLVTDGIRTSKLNYVKVQLFPMIALNIPGSLSLLRRPTMQFNYHFDKTRNWDILSHLRFNFQSILGQGNSVEQLKNIFRLYNIIDNNYNNIYIDSIKNITTSQVVEPIRIQGKCCYVYGTKIIITLNLQEFKDSSYIFAEFLDSFFAYFINYNSFIQLDIMTEESDKPYISFPRRLGCKEIF
ncbi:MAG: type VI secretion system baseplate subunit TssF [Succinivibrionaceae bacterium]|nr:type VI secretion system baseplate subunit TssF [Ruminobacter sp.]MDY5779590.1 type VI secretion system baseplate subunit TssF [Succinivibrionaceae bacterium]MEE1340939.1 type VI secretion system baseplate subunit TssF [Succinivibrionaceae bacterium]